MRKAKVLVNGTEAGILSEIEYGAQYVFEYADGYEGPEISRTMPVKQKKYSFDRFPPFFDGLLPEGFQLDGLLKVRKIDHNDITSLYITASLFDGYLTEEEINNR